MGIVHTQRDFEAALYAMAERKELRKRKQRINVAVHTDFLKLPYNISVRIDAWEGYYETHKIRYARRPTLITDVYILPITLKYVKDNQCQKPTKRITR